MKQTKKGFTLVELLVVIAILAVLATVSIVGYLSFINKANISVDEHAVTQFNIVLEGEEILGNVPENAYDVKAIFTTHGYNQELVPITAGYTFYWYKTDNIVVLTDGDGKITFPQKYEGTVVSQGDENYIDLSGIPYAIVEEKHDLVVTPDQMLSGFGGLPQINNNVTFDNYLKFSATETQLQSADSQYADWLCDFRITVNKPLNTPGCTYYIGGQYTSFSEQWVVLDITNVEELEGGYPMSYLLLGMAMGMEMTYEDICTSVKDFQCGFGIDGSDPGFEITVELVLFESAEAYYNGDFLVVSHHTYNY